MAERSGPAAAIMAAGCAYLSEEHFVSAWGRHISPWDYPAVRLADADCDWAIVWRLASAAFWWICVPLWFIAGQIDNAQHPHNDYDPANYPDLNQDTPPAIMQHPTLEDYQSARVMMPAEFDNPTEEDLAQMYANRESAAFWRHFSLDWVIWPILAFIAAAIVMRPSVSIPCFVVNAYCLGWVFWKILYYFLIIGSIGLLWARAEQNDLFGRVLRTTASIVLSGLILGWVARRIDERSLS